MSKIDSQEALTKQLVERAQNQQYSKFDFIRNIEGLKVTGRYFNSVARVKIGFNQVSKKTMAEYEKSFSAGSSNVETLITYAKLVQCANFYEAEQRLAKEMIREYISYVFSGHVIQTLLGYERPEEDLVDYRR